MNNVISVKKLLWVRLNQLINNLCLIKGCLTMLQVYRQEILIVKMIICMISHFLQIEVQSMHRLWARKVQIVVKEQNQLSFKCIKSQCSVWMDFCLQRKIRKNEIVYFIISKIFKKVINNLLIYYNNFINN